MKRDPKFEVPGSKFRKPRTSDLEPLARPTSLACLARHAPRCVALADFSAPRLEVLMIISTVMSPRKKDLDEELIEPEVLGPPEEEAAEISPPPEVSHRAAPEDHHATDATAVVPVTALQQYLAEVRRYPYKRSHLVALRATKSLASDPPSTWWPGQRQMIVTW